jgi:phosphoribosylglycinamide formyltransferase-1
MLDCIGVLISGRGSNLQALIDAGRSGDLRARIGVVIANRAEAGGLELARAAGIEALVMPHRAHADREQYDRALIEVLTARRVRLVCLAGFMRLLGPLFCEAFPFRVLNVHPSLLPAFPGARAIEEALAWGVKLVGATVHFVDEQVDHGPIIAQEAVAVRADDTAASLHARVQAVEHHLLPDAVRAYCAGTLKIEGRHVRIIS